jgi:subtilisin family serine protease
MLALLLVLAAAPAVPERIVLTRPGVALEEVLAAHPRVEVVRRFGALPGFVARGSEDALRALASDERVRAMQADALGHASTDEAAALTGARHATLELGYTGRGVRLAVLDTGVDRAHPDLDGGLVLEKCFVLGGCPPTNQDTGDEAPEGSGHGTHVAGIITGDGRIAPRGVAEQAELVMVRVFNQQSVGRVSDWVAALDWVLAHHAEQRVREIGRASCRERVS